MQVPTLSHHRPRITDPTLYLATLHAPAGARLLVGMVASVVCKGRRFQPSEARLAEMLHVSRRSIIRYSQLLQARGWLRVIRRGRRLTNVYRLSRELFHRITGQRPVPSNRPLQAHLFALGRKLGILPPGPSTGVAAPPNKTPLRPSWGVAAIA